MPTPLSRVTSRNSESDGILESLTADGINVDPVQNELINILESVSGGRDSDKPGGVYIYGPPGRGKTLITNALVALRPADTTKRFHFHEFFHKLNSPAYRVPGQPLGAIFTQGLERELSSVNVLVFDEFHCTEPGDAMFVGKLVKYCREHDIQLVTTSNYEPEKLLDDDTFHHLVKPVIEHIRQNFEVFELDHSRDYRLLNNTPDGSTTGYRAGSLTLIPRAIAMPALDAWIEIGYDRIGPAAMEGECIWINFDQLCRTRRNTADYLDLASRYSRWHITDIPSSLNIAMDEERRLANLIDVFYDKDVEVHLYAVDDLSQLGNMLHGTEKARLTSRLAQLERNYHERIDASR